MKQFLRMRSLRRFAVVAAMAVLASGIASGGPARAADTLRVGKAMAAAFNFVPLDVGIAQGIFKKHGLDVQSISFGGSAKLQQALAAGSIDMGLGSGPELAFAAKGAPVQGVGAIAYAPGLLVLAVGADTPIHSLADLKGKKIAVSTVGSLTSWLTRRLSEKQGWGPNGIDTVPLGADPALVAAVRTHEVDGLVFDIASALKLQQMGAVRILVKFGDMEKNFLINVIYANKAILAKNPGAVRRFLAAWYETIGYMQHHKAETVKIMTPVIGVSPEIADQTYDYLMPMFSDNGKFPPKALAVLAQSFVGMGILPKAPDMATLVTEKYLPAAPQ